MEITLITEDKKDFLDLLLLADEQEDMIDRYLARGEMFAACQGKTVIGVCVVTKESSCLYEIKNFAIAPPYQKQGYGKAFIAFICNYYQEEHRYLQVGTGAGTPTVRFYEKCGFTISHTVPDFFTRFYDHPIYEDGIRLTDMVYLQKPLFD
ncbi:MAG: GNAT family N-acetyltransferase [Peptococcaceae bacterium]|jgi:GNAT superfamily N-acetyltransferase|nr:GNAT family N-acetyltransferase [Peptococcaceae bacterium]